MFLQFTNFKLQFILICPFLNFLKNRINKAEAQAVPAMLVIQISLIRDTNGVVSWEHNSAFIWNNCRCFSFSIGNCPKVRGDYSLICSFFLFFTVHVPKCAGFPERGFKVGWRKPVFNSVHNKALTVTGLNC